MSFAPKHLASDRGNAQELEMIGIIRGHPEQKRKALNYDSRLAAAARAKALDMGRRNYFGHEDPEGVSANFSVAAAGYRLPPAYMAFKSGNQIESLAAGKKSARETFEQWMESWGHESQVLALAPFFRLQTNYGVGYAKVPGSTHQHYWIFLTAPPESGR
ncbi:MAG: CAP domain-containing protein [Akkermansiaceae bacterium]